MTDHDTKRVYERAGIGHTIRRGTHTGVLVVDLSVGFTSSEYPTGADLSREVRATGRLLEAERGQSLPSLCDAGVWLQKVPGLGSMVLGTPQVELDERLGRWADEPVIVKTCASAFFGTNLAGLLAAARVTR